MPMTEQQVAHAILAWLQEHADGFDIDAIDGLAARLHIEIGRREQVPAAITPQALGACRRPAAGSPSTISVGPPEQVLAETLNTLDGKYYGETRTNRAQYYEPRAQALVRALEDAGYVLTHPRGEE